MSLEEEDASLKDLVTKTLQSNGVLGKLQAQLRASVFLALEDEFREKDIPLINKGSKQILSSCEGGLAAALVYEFLQCLNLEFSQTVFGPESGLSTVWTLPGHQNLRNSLGMGEAVEEMNGVRYPILCQLLKEKWLPQSALDSQGPEEKGVHGHQETEATEEIVELPDIKEDEQLPVSSIALPEPDKGDASEKSVLSSSTSGDNKDKVADGGSPALHSRLSSQVPQQPDEDSLTSKASEQKQETSEGRKYGSNQSAASGSESRKDGTADCHSSLAGAEKQYEDDFSSSHEREHEIGSQDNEAMETEDEVEEEIDEECSLGDILSSAMSQESDITRDISASQGATDPNYEEDL